MKEIPLTLQSIDSKDINEVAKVLKADWITQGPKVKEFEEKLCQYTGAKFAVAVSSGTAALHTACLAAGIKKGDEVITSPITFVATANCVLYCGGKPVFVDICEDTINIDTRKIEKKITKRTKAIIPVHFTGYPADLSRIKKIAKRRKLLVIEDAAHALGAKYKGSKIGSCKYSDMAVLSFHPAKTITTGEGGAVLTNDRKLYEKLLLYRSHGITKDKRLMKNNPGPWFHEMQVLGFNYRLTDFQSALGISQLKKVDKFVSRRKSITKKYDNAFKSIDWITPLLREKDRELSNHLYVVKIDFKKIRKTRKQFMQHLQRQGIHTQVHYIPVHLQPYYKKNLGYRAGNYPEAEKYYKEALSLPIFVGMQGKEINYVIKKILRLGS